MIQTKLAQVRGEQPAMRRQRVTDGAAHWRSSDQVLDRYYRVCERLHISSGYYDLEFASEPSKRTMAFRMDHYAVKKKRKASGESRVVTDNDDWIAADLVDANLNRWQLENESRDSNDGGLVGRQPVRHQTDGRMRCHLSRCTGALTRLRHMELRRSRTGLGRSAELALMKHMRLHSILRYESRERKPRYTVEQSSETQAVVLSAGGRRIDSSGVLQPLRP